MARKTVHIQGFSFGGPIEPNTTYIMDGPLDLRSKDKPWYTVTLDGKRPASIGAMSVRGVDESGREVYVSVGQDQRIIAPRITKAQTRELHRIANGEQAADMRSEKARVHLMNKGLAWRLDSKPWTWGLTAAGALLQKVK